METSQKFSGTRRYLRHICVPALILSLAGAGCKGRRNRVSVQNEEDTSAPLAMSVRMGDPRASAQLINGFFGIEANSWRWTGGKFSVVLRPPASGAKSGAVLKFAFVAPDVVMQKLKTITLSSSIAGTALKSQEYTAPGTHVFSTDVPASLLTGDAVKVEFALDKTFAAGGADSRELGVIANQVGFEAR